jgi:plastocyanin
MVRLIKFIAVLMLCSIPAYAAGTVDVIQKDRSFTVPSIDIPVGTTVRFLNEDEFIHHIYVKSPTFNFSSDESPPGHEVDLRFTVPGTFTVRCAIHPKMHLTVTVH